ncbi:MAG TPA: hypothetical protein VMS08_05605 [Candidatus Saccharimonadia bacterium]|nr:hypothetical protein [Candidatus Saccharimonadia bacterium]
MILYFLIAILAAGLLLYSVIVSGHSNKRKSRLRRAAPSSRGSRGFVDPTEIRARWQTITATAGGGASGLKSAINEADKLFDHVLKQIGMSGETMAERLKSARHRFAEYADYDAVWRAHKLRNSLAHDIGFDLVPTQAREALSDFERGLKSLGAL